MCKEHRARNKTLKHLGKYGKYRADLRDTRSLFRKNTAKTASQIFFLCDCDNYSLFAVMQYGNLQLCQHSI